MCMSAGFPHGLRVGVVGPEVQGHGTDDSKLGGHLLHPSEPSLFLRICKLYHQAGRGALRRKRQKNQNSICLMLLASTLNISKRLKHAQWKDYHCYHHYSEHFSLHPNKTG